MNQTAEMLIKFYNMQAGTSARAKNERNQEIVIDALNRAGGDVATLKSHIRKWVADNPTRCNTGYFLTECMMEYGTAPEPVKVEQVQPHPQPTEQAVTSSLGILEQAVVKMISEMQADKIEQAVMGSVEDKVRNFIKEEYGTIERKITTVIDDVPRDMHGIQHEKFETILKFVANDEPVFLMGPAGAGKNVICKQVAEALGLKFYFSNAVTQEYKLTGFTDANGHYQPTQFYKAFTEGGVFMLDEIDASIPEVLVILNAAIANRYFDFPAPIGYVEAHPNFRVVAAGNTYGTGADVNYVGRNQLDGASLDRFALVKIDYSEAIENNVANGDRELVTFAHEVRKAADRAGIQIIVSYRSIGRIAKMVKLLSVDEALETCLIKGMEADDVNHLCEGISTDSKYARGLRTLCRRLAA